MSEVITTSLWMKHREKQGVWHLAVLPDELIKLAYNHNGYVTACRGDMLYGSIGPILDRFIELPKSAKCVRCTKIWLENNNT